MWFYSVKNLKREFSKIDFEELEEVRLKLFEMDYKIGNGTNFSFEIPIKNKKALGDTDAYYCSTREIIKYISGARANNHNGSRRSTIDFNELSDLSDEEDSICQNKDQLPTRPTNNVSRTEARGGFFDQPIPSYNEDRETESLKLSSHDDSEDVSGMGSGDIDWSLDISKI